MATDAGPLLGQLIEDGDRRRDAIHIAVAPVTASQQLNPGEHIGFVEEANVELVGSTPNTIGIVDPFLTQDVEPGQRFWMFLYPSTITGLRHIWTHPEFAAASRMAREKLE